MSCNDCDAVYIGETGGSLMERTEKPQKCGYGKSNLECMYTFMFHRLDIPSISWTSVLLEYQITSEYDENWREPLI